MYILYVYVPLCCTCLMTLKSRFHVLIKTDENVHRAEGKHPHAIHTDIMHTCVRVNRCCLQYSQIFRSQKYFKLYCWYFNCPAHWQFSGFVGSGADYCLVGALGACC